ncbi:MAG: hypothetical protein WC528_00850 [Patescibacteria group bacterium]
MPERENDNIEKALSDALVKEKVEEELGQLNQKETELNIFIQKKSEGLLPDSKEIIKEYIPIAQAFQREMVRENVYDRQSLLSASKTLEDIAGQVGVNLEHFFEQEKYQKFEPRLIDIMEEVKATRQDAEKISEEDEEAKGILSQKIQYKYRSLRDLLIEMFQDGLTESDKQLYGELPREILNKIREVEHKHQTNE